jgi:hypothetical protein
MKEERNLIRNLASLIEGYLNGVKGKEGRYVTRDLNPSAYVGTIEMADTIIERL